MPTQVSRVMAHSRSPLWTPRFVTEPGATLFGRVTASRCRSPTARGSQAPRPRSTARSTSHSTCRCLRCC
jgi:hypothetical protein